MQETAKYKERLEAERERICRQMELAESEVLNQDHSVQDAMPQSGDDEIADAAMGTYTQELEAALVRRAQNRLATVDSALERMQVERSPWKTWSMAMTACPEAASASARANIWLR